VESISRAKLKLQSSKIIREKVLIPGLVDCHTHLAFAGDRADEWGRRLAGASYVGIARLGGGNKKTVQATRNASESELVRLAESRLKTFLRFGVTTVESKTGYGLDLESELKLLNVLNRVKKRSQQELAISYMGAHAIPSEFSSEA